MKTSKIIKINDTYYIVSFLRRDSYTQCIIEDSSGWVIGAGESNKDSRDIDQPVIGKRMALKWALKNVNSKELRTMFWKKLQLD